MLVHWAKVHDHRTACGKWALEIDGTTRRLETDIDPNQVSCKVCLRMMTREPR